MRRCIGRETKRWNEGKRERERGCEQYRRGMDGVREREGMSSTGEGWTVREREVV